MSVKMLGASDFSFVSECQQAASLLHINDSSMKFPGAVAGHKSTTRGAAKGDFFFAVGIAFVDVLDNNLIASFF
jgi:hypothetical protein